jgi:hypothetical protein
MHSFFFVNRRKVKRLRLLIAFKVVFTRSIHKGNSQPLVRVGLDFGNLQKYRRSIQNQPMGREIKPTIFFPLNRLEMFWQVVIQGFSANPAVTNLYFDEFEVA